MMGEGRSAAEIALARGAEVRGLRAEIERLMTTRAPTHRDEATRAEALTSIAAFLRLAQGAYPTPLDAAEGLLRRLDADGLAVVKAPAP